jgi:uncharacterized protein
MEQERPLAIVTGASSGIGLELAFLAAQHGHDLVIGADRSLIFEAAEDLRELGVRVEAVEADLSTIEGNDQLVAAARGRPVELLCANAGHGLGRSFLEQPFEASRHVIDTNVTGTLYLIHKVGRSMSVRGAGHILITGSIAGFVPGPYQAVYNSTKAFIDSFAIALRAELKGSGVTVTNLMPGLTDTDFFRRADLLDTKAGAAAKQPADEVARIGYEAMLRGEAEVVAGWKNKLLTVMAGLVPHTMLAEQHRLQAAPGSAKS